MPNTFNLQLYQPLGTLKATHNATASTTSQFHTSNADASDLEVGMLVRCYNVFIFSHIYIGEVNITSIQADTPSVGITRITFSPVVTSVPTNGCQMYVPEIINPTTAIADQMQIIDNRMDATLCTPSTRPILPFPGQLSMESAVLGVGPFELRYWTGSTWQLIVGSGGGVAGRLGYTSQTVAGPNVTAGITTGPYMSITFGAIAGHTYLIDVGAAVEASGALESEAMAYLYVKSGGSVDTSGTKIGAMGFDTDIEGLPVHNSFCIPWTAPSSGTFTVGLFLKKPEDTGSIFDSVSFSSGFNTMSIEDGGVL